MSGDVSIWVRALQWLLNLDQIRLGDDSPLYLRWNSPYPAWLLFVFGALVLAFIALAYTREHGGWGRRTGLAAVRAGLAALVIATLCQPMLIWQRNRVWPSHVSLLVDTSASMARTDRYSDDELGLAVAKAIGVSDPSALTKISRLEVVRRALASEGAAALRGLLARNGLRIHQFSGSVQPVAAAGAESELDAALARLGTLTADGQTTSLAASLADALKPKDGGRLAAVVLASDGRSTESSSSGLAEAIARARSQQVPVYPLLIGSPIPPRDVGIRSMTWDAHIFAKDILAVRLRLESRGLTAPTPVIVRLIDARSGAIVATRTVDMGGDHPGAEVELRTKPAPGSAGRLRYRVEVVALEGEEELENNSDAVEAVVRDTPCRVLYVEGGPRFEYRYLKNALVREETIKASVLLLSADRDFAQEGTAPVRRFPETPEELSAYDVVLFGDVDPSGDWLSPSQMELLVEFVGDRGGGFGLIAGEHSAPHRFRGTPLEKLIPVRIDPDAPGSHEGTLSTAFIPQVTGEGERSRLFRFISDGESAGALIGALPGWYWFAQTLGPRAGAEVLLQNASGPAAAGPIPLVVMGRYGSGKTLFHGSDDTWRWRRHTGELVYDGYWVQAVRALMPSAGSGADATARLGRLMPSKRRYRYGERVEIQVQIDDPASLSRMEEGIPIIVRDKDDAPAAKLDGKRLSESSGVFDASFVPPGAGTFTLTVDPAVLPTLAPGESPPTASIQVEGATLESARVEADHDTLARLAQETGGELVPLDRLGDVFGRLRDRSLQIPDDVSETLWDSRLVLILFVLGISLEWILRKAFGMI